MAAVPRSGTPEASAAPSRPAPQRVLASPAVFRRRLLPSAAAVVAVAVLFAAYLRVSRTYPENSDEANILLMSWDMLHGNVLLHGWYLSDVSFYPTELPQYALLEAISGLHADTAHLAAAMTYTLVLLLAVLLARGRAAQPGGSETVAWPRMALTAGLMIAPQLGVGVFVLLLSVGHIGTAVPLMLIWLVIDLAGSRPHWAVPVVVAILMTWVLVADPLALVVGIVPLAAVCALRAIAALRAAAPGERSTAAHDHWYEVSLAAAAIVSYGLATLVNRLLRAAGGFVLHPLPYHLAPVHTWPKHAWVTGEGLLALFGARPQGPAAVMAFALLHLAGVALVAWAIGRVARRFFRWPDLISQVLLVAVVLNVLVYVPSTLANATDLNAREFAVVLPFGAVLAGRALCGPAPAGRALCGPAPAGQDILPSMPGWLRGARWRAWLAAAAAAGYLASLGYAAAQPSASPASTELAQFLAGHHLTYGVAGYWQASIVTVASDGAVSVRAVQPSLKPYLWEAKGSWYDPSLHRATFLVTDSQPGFFNQFQVSGPVPAALGPPAATYHVGPYTVMVWDTNLLAGAR